MSSNLTIIILLFGILWILWYFLGNVKFKEEDDLLVQNYYTKQKFKQRLVLVIEQFDDLNQLLTLIRNILKQDIKVDLLVLISNDENLKKVNLIQNTCIINKLGGLSFLLKESDRDSILLFLFPPSFNDFSNPKFLNYFLNSSTKTRGLIQVKNNSVLVDINKVYDYHKKN
ncbi:hypothetical protein IIV22_061R [Invertebrate iridescent virus 22]|uniref:Uncharacterized protein n=1 Tax=Invertebrate iridescent virus 22 TaxID=345198 RepID=S6DA60_9VIRU|nr:hypothetical protein IIV22_061R [Invertebrate iridescent virus 22]CCV01738.1 hypothetical protein IIV22_061R [Invertebrate iridescent virus 22]